MLPENVKWDAVFQSIVDTWLPLIGVVAAAIVIAVNCPCGQEKKEIRISGSDEAVTLIEASILDNVTRESVESTLVKNGNRLVRNSIDVSV